MVKLRELGWFAERHAAFDLSTGRGLERVGLHDIEVCVAGRFLAIEAKRDLAAWRKWKHDKSKEAPAQKKVQEEVRIAGGISICTWRYEDVERAVQCILKGVPSDIINKTIDQNQVPFLSGRTKSTGRPVLQQKGSRTKPASADAVASTSRKIRGARRTGN